jgi:cyclic pyranopterin phosphate synthase
MSPKEILTIACVATNLGVENVKITGGEPLLREDLHKIVAGLRSIGVVKRISMVTNGRLLSLSTAKNLRKAGLDRVNISLQSINPSHYLKMTGGNLDDAVKGVKNAVEGGLNPVKLNMVLMKGLNDREIEDVIGFARELGAVLQIIELEPVNVNPETYKRFHVSLDGVEAWLKPSARAVRVRKSMQARKVYSLQGVDVELVKPIENTAFCAHCTRIRVTSDGKLKPCLMINDNLVDILTPLRNGAGSEELEEIFLKAVDLREPYWKG